MESTHCYYSVLELDRLFNKASDDIELDQYPAVVVSVAVLAFQSTIV